MTSGRRKGFLDLIALKDKASSIQYKGLFLVLIGPDGAGKSTLSSGLINGIANKDIFNGHVYYHTSVGLLPPLKYFRNLFSITRSSTRPPEKTGELPGMVTPHPLWRSLGYLFYYSVDYIVGLSEIRKHTGQRKLVIFDRYFYDFFYQRQNRKLPDWLLWFCYRFIPKPDLVICLSAEPEMFHTRKPELSIEEIDEQLKRIKTLASKLKNTLVLDTSKDPVESVKLVENKINKLLSMRNCVGVQ